MSGPTFGNDGWRGIIARDFTCERVAQVTRAIIAYLEEENLAERGLVVGFDRRFQSRAFALEVAETAAQLGLKPTTLYGKMRKLGIQVRRQPTVQPPGETESATGE